MKASYAARLGTMTTASPSITTFGPTLQVVSKRAKHLSTSRLVIVARATTVSPARTGAQKRQFWLT
jgi:hypothetical protein